MHPLRATFIALLGTGCAATSPQPATCAAGEAPPSPCVLMVDRDVEEPGCGQDWGRAHLGIQAAIDRAHAFVEGDADLEYCEVWVAEGSYSSFAERHSDTLQLRPGVRLYGGFSGVETRREDRDPALHTTRLDGTEQGGVERVYHVVTGAEDALIDGFTIARGWARSSRFGGGLYNDGVSPTVVGCTFEENVSDFYGGAIFNSLNEAVVEDCRFVDNKGRFGGAIYQQGGTLTVTGTTFEGNRATESGGAIASVSFVELFAAESAFRDNSAKEYGGALYNNYRTQATLEDCTLEGNTAGEEGDDVHDEARSETTFVEAS